MALAAATRLGPYEILGLIGAGGMGEVYKATDTRLERSVAIKVLPADVSKDSDRRLRFEREAKTIGRLAHPHICTLFDIGEHQGSLFLVMELLDGETLATRLEEGALRVDELLTIGTEIADALSAAHQHGIVHRDLKPANVMLTKSGVKLLDFGLSQPTREQDCEGTESTRTTMQLGVSGTVPYMSPEQALGNRGDHRSDLFSLGVVLYEMATGRTPFSGSTVYELVDNILHQDPENIRSLNSLIPARLERIITALLEKRAEERIQTAADLIGEFQKCGTGSQSPTLDSQANENLPQQLTRFIGRQKEVAGIRESFRRSRLVTLTGPAGIGKTRLALQVAAASQGDYAGGVWLVELAALADAGLVPNTVAFALGLREEGGRTITDTLLNYLKNRNVLLVLDNCEHLITACAQLAALLLRTAPGLNILATSRESLTILGETVFHVRPLTMPDPRRLPNIADLQEHESVQLFVDRARCVKPSFEIGDSNAALVARVCVQLDGIPLAIELAASRMKVLSLEHIVARLDDRFTLLTRGNRAALPRHRTLLAAIEWSYNLLSEPEKMLFRRLSVFSGGWTLDAAEVVCAGRGVNGESVLDLMTELVDKSLVLAEERGGHERYRFMVTLQEFAQHRLMQSGEDKPVSRAHAEFYLTLAVEAEPQLASTEQKAWLELLNVDYDNFRAALQWMCKEDVSMGLALAGALGRFWYVRGYWDEGRQWLERMLGATDAVNCGAERAKALNAAALMAEHQTDLVASRLFAEEALRLSRQLGDKHEIAVALNCLAVIAGSRSQFPLARSYVEEALIIRRDLGDKSWIATLLNNAGGLAFLQGECRSAGALFDESLSLSREVGDKHRIATALLNRGDVARRLGDHAMARSFVEEALGLAKDLGDRSLMPLAFHSLGDLAARRGDYSDARALLIEGLEIARELGDKWLVLYLLQSLGLVAEGFAAARPLFEESLAIAQEAGDKRGVATALNCLGQLSAQEGDKTAAQKSFEESLAICSDLGLKDGVAHSLEGLGDVARLHGDYRMALSFYRHGLAIWWELGEKPEVPRVAETLASLLLATGQPDCAVRLLAAVNALRDELSVRRSPSESSEYQRHLATARITLGDDRFAAVWELGQSTSIDTAVTTALQAANGQQV